MLPLATLAAAAAATSAPATQVSTGAVAPSLTKRNDGTSRSDDDSEDAESTNLLNNMASDDAPPCPPIEWSKALDKDKEIEWVAQFTLDNVEVEQGEVPVAKTIGGVLTKNIRVKSLHEFCRKNKITGFKQRTKLEICRAIATAKGVESVYNDSDNEKEEANNDSNRKPKQKKATIPAKVKVDGTLYRVINVFFSEKHRDDVTSLGRPPKRHQLDSSKWLHHDTYEKLAETYNDDDPETNEGIDNLQVEDDAFAGSDPSEYDQGLDGVDIKEIMDFLAYQYREACNKKTRSGNHGDFSRACGHKVYLYYLYLMLGEHGDLIEFVDADLGGAFEEEGVNNDSDQAGNNQGNRSQKTPTARAKRIKRRSSPKDSFESYLTEFTKVTMFIT